MTTKVTSAVDEDVLTARFACDLGRCKGACCTLPGGRGAPLDDAEVGELRRAFGAARKYLSARSLQSIEAQGFVEGFPGHYHTTCIDDKDCVFVVMEEGIARCALEKAHLAGETAWRKPISCHLYPLRISPDGAQVRYERIAECIPGAERGAAEDIALVDFLREPLERRFGRSWYAAFRAACPDGGRP
jgi:hypothetical protein